MQARYIISIYDVILYFSQYHNPTDHKSSHTSHPLSPQQSNHTTTILNLTHIPLSPPPSTLPITTNMDLSQPPPQSEPSSSSPLPPEAIALAGRLFEAARKGDQQSEALLRAALERGGERLANLTNDKGDSLIMLSSYHGHPTLVRLLLHHKANPNRLNDRGQSPLAGVVFKNERECILALLEGGADPELGTPSAIGACEIFRQDEYLGLFREQVEKLRDDQAKSNGNGNSNSNGNGMNGVDGGSRSNEPSTTGEQHPSINGNSV